MTSKFKGVNWHKRDEAWQAVIVVNCKQLWIGYYSGETEATEAYDTAARKHFGEFACVNFPRIGEQAA